MVERIRTLGEWAADRRTRTAEVARALEDAEARDAEGDFASAVSRTMNALTAHARSALTKGWPERRPLYRPSSTKCE